MEGWFTCVCGCYFYSAFRDEYKIELYTIRAHRNILSRRFWLSFLFRSAGVHLYFKMVNVFSDFV